MCLPVAYIYLLKPKVLVFFYFEPLKHFKSLSTSLSLSCLRILAWLPLLNRLVLL